MYPNYYLTLYMDPFLYEIEADRSAIKIGIDPNDLIKAIIKLGVIDLGGKPPRWEKIAHKMYRTVERVFRIKGIKMVNEFFFGDAILGYTHPLLMQRMAYLQGIKE
jgi:Zn-dependent protease with chaperone function